MPLSDFVGLLFNTVTASPDLILPPTNSLPPLRWLMGRVGTVLGESGAEGDFGGTRNALSAGAGEGRAAPGLNEKAGSVGDLSLEVSLSVVITSPGSWVSTADRGRRPVARERDDGAEDDDGRAGKTKGGFGGGGFDLGDVWGFGSDESGEVIPASVVAAKWRSVSPLKPSAIDAPTIISGPIVAAIFQCRSAA